MQEMALETFENSKDPSPPPPLPSLEGRRPKSHSFNNVKVVRHTKHNIA